MKVDYSVWLKIEAGDLSDPLTKKVAKEITRSLKAEQQVDVFRDGKFRGCVMAIDGSQRLMITHGVEYLHPSCRNIEWE